MIHLAKDVDLFSQRMGDLRLSQPDKQVLVFYRKGLLFAFNFSPSTSYTDVKVSLPNCADYTVAFTTDDGRYGGWDRIEHCAYKAQVDEKGASEVHLYLPARTAMVLREGKICKPRKKAAPKAKTTK
jgi:1,4-alpha-glucan branching enzyme